MSDEQTQAEDVEAHHLVKRQGDETGKPAPQTSRPDADEDGPDVEAHHLVKKIEK